MKVLVVLAAALSFAPLNADAAPERIAQLKAQITEIATANQLRQDNLPAVRAQLQPLVDELVALVPARTEAEKAPEVVGGWRNLWSDMTFGPYLDYANIYQVVYADGFYYNISRLTPPHAEVTGYLRGVFADAGDHLAIEFTANVTVPGWLPTGADLVAAGRRVETGATVGTDQPGPIGVRGRLQNTYVDATLRIVTGQSTTDARDSLFVLERAPTVP